MLDGIIIDIDSLADEDIFTIIRESVIMREYFDKGEKDRGDELIDRAGANLEIWKTEKGVYEVVLWIVRGDKPDKKLTNTLKTLSRAKEFFDTLSIQLNL